jgi:hypothetical protein
MGGYRCIYYFEPLKSKDLKSSELVDYYIEYVVFKEY